MEKIVFSLGSLRRKELLARTGVVFLWLEQWGRENQPDRSSGNSGKAFAG